MRVKVTDELMDDIVVNFRNGLQGFMTICLYPLLRPLLRTESEARKLAAEIGEDLASCLEDYSAIDQVLPHVMNRYNTEKNMKGTRAEYTSSLETSEDNETPI